MKLVLFDIDGTLLISNGVGRQAIEKALSELVGQTLSTEAVSFSGKTDPQIMREVLTSNGVEATDALVEEALRVYVATAASVTGPNTVETLPGVAPLLDRLAANPNVRLGLVTGNVEVMAFRKLEAANLDAYFSFGAFGSDHADRNRLPPLALSRAAQHTGVAFEAARTVIVGDTARDVECARYVGAAVVGVCTGHSSRDDLAPHAPDWLFDDLRNTDDVVDALLAERPPVERSDGAASAPSSDAAPPPQRPGSPPHD